MARSAILVGAIVLASAPARADRFPRFELGAGTAVPLSVDLEAAALVTDKLGVEVAIGMLPGPYVDVINATVVALDGYDETTADVIAAALDQALIVRASFMVAPFRFPLSFHAGYTLATLGGGLGAGVAIEALTGESIRTDVGDEIPIASTVHLVQIGAAWRFDLPRGLVLRLSLEYTQPFASSTQLDATSRTPGGQQRVDRASQELDAYLDDVYTSDVKAPVIGVSLRWRYR